MGSLFLYQPQEDRYPRSVWLSLVLILSVMINSISSETEPKTASLQNLRAKLFEHYDKLVRPVVDQKTVTPVYLGLAPLQLTDLDEEKQIIHMDSWILMKWKDEFLVWNPQEHGGITSFIIPSTEIWRPDVTIYTGSPANKIVINVLTNAIINFTGDVLWVPPMDVRSRCEMHSYGGFQQDSHTCVVRLGSWTYHEYKLNLQKHEHDVRLDDFQNVNLEWDVVSVTTERKSKIYPCCKEPYPYIDFKFNLRRRSNSRSCGSGHRVNHMAQHHCPSSSDNRCH